MQPVDKSATTRSDPVGATRGPSCDGKERSQLEPVTATGPIAAAYALHQIMRQIIMRCR
jgi:hypothetical protein